MDWHEFRNLVLGTVFILSAIFVVFTLVIPVPGSTLNVRVIFPPKDQSRLAPPVVIRKDVNTVFRTRKVLI